MKFQHIETFLAVAENLSFSKAAENLGYSQSAVTVQIKELEKELGTILFERLNKTVRFTSEGRTFFNYAQKVEYDTRQIIQQMRKSEVEGELRIGIWQTVNTYLFPEILLEYNARFPQVNIVLCEPSYKEVFEKLVRNDIDMAYIMDEPVSREDMVKELDIQENIVFVASNDHPLAGQNSLKLEDLVAYDFLLTERNYCYYEQLKRNMANKGLDFHVFLESGNTEPLKILAMHGVGIAFLPEFSVRSAIREKKLTKLDVVDCAVNIRRQVIYHKNKWVSAQMNAMLDLIKEREIRP